MWFRNALKILGTEKRVDETEDEGEMSVCCVLFQRPTGGAQQQHQRNTTTEVDWT